MRELTTLGLCRMRDYVLYMWIGLGLFIVPFLGIPGSWKETLIALAALFVVVYSFMKHRHIRRAIGSGSGSRSSLNTGDRHSEEQTSVSRQNAGTP